MRASVTAPDSIPQALHVPTVAQAVVVQVPDGPAARLDPPVLAVPAVGPPAALDPPTPDHIGDLVPAAPPDEGRGHPGVPFDPNLDLLVVPLGHRFSRSDRPPKNRTYVREGTVNVRPAGDASQARVSALGGGLAALVPLAMERAPPGLVEVAHEDPVDLDRLAAVVPEGHAPVGHAPVALN